MKLTLQAEDVRQFRRLVSTLIVRPTNSMLQFVDFHGKFAMMLCGYDWTFVMPIRGRRPTKSFKIPLLPLWNTCERADDKLTINIDTKKGRGAVEWLESRNWRGSHPFTFGLYNYTVSPIPKKPTETITCQAPLLSALTKCSKICAKPYSPSLCTIRITPGGEFGCTDGKRMLLEQTSARFPWSENILVRATVRSTNGTPFDPAGQPLARLHGRLLRRRVHRRRGAFNPQKRSETETPNDQTFRPAKKSADFLKNKTMRGNLYY